MTTVINILSIIAGILFFLVFHNAENSPMMIFDVEDRTMALVALTILTMIAVQIFFLPVRIADSQDHPNLLPITVLTIAGGWTGILWVGALIWSLYTPQVEIKVNTTIIDNKEKGE